jgi:hypothetical protein
MKEKVKFYITSGLNLDVTFLGVMLSKVYDYLRRWMHPYMQWELSVYSMVAEVLLVSWVTHSWILSQCIH